MSARTRRSRIPRGRDAIAAVAMLVMLAAPAAAREPRAQAHVVTVFAAASLTDAFGELAHRFEVSHPGVTVRVAFAGSQQLVAQLAAGARADVFAAADTKSMADARAQGSVSEQPLVFARNVLAVITPAANPARLDRVEQLSRPGVKLVLCASNVPAGRYARDLFARLETSGSVPKGWGAKVFANLVSEEDNVRAVVGKVRLGEADAGVVYRSDLEAAPRGTLRVLAVPDSLDPIAEYPIATVGDAPERDLAHAFVSFVCGDDGQRVLMRHGFLAAPLTTATP